VRILGEVKKEYADLLRRADHIFIEELRKADWYHKVSQAFVVFQPVKSVGVVGDGRRYAWVVALRCGGNHRLHDRPLGTPALRTAGNRQRPYHQ